MESARCARPGTPAHELAGCLLDYELALQALGRGPFDPARCRRLIEELTAIGHCTMAVPELAGDFVELTVQHFEMVRVLCRPRALARRVTPQAALALLRGQCERVRAMRSPLLAGVAAQVQPQRRGAVPPTPT